MAGAEVVMLTLAVVLVWQLRSIVLLIFAAVVGAVAMDMPVAFLTRQWPFVPRLYFVITVLAGLACGLWILILFMLPEVLFQARELAALGPQIVNATRTEGMAQLSELENFLEEHFFDMERFALLRAKVQERLEAPDLYSSLLKQLQPAGVLILQGISALIPNLARCVLVGILSTLLCLKPAEHRAVMVNSLPAYMRWRALEILDMCREALGSLLLGLAISSFGVGVLTWLGLAILGCPVALFSGLLLGLLTFIPTVGPPLGVLFPAGVSMVKSRTMAMEALSWAATVQYVVKPILKPRVMLWLAQWKNPPAGPGSYVNILPTTALLAQAGFGLLLGFPGALLALPFVAVWQVVLREAFQRELMDRWVTWGPPQQRRKRRGSAKSRHRSANGRLHSLQPPVIRRGESAPDGFGGLL